MNDRPTNVPEDQLADLLRAAGFDQPIHIDQEWRDGRMPWLPDGQSEVVRIVGIYNLVSGWTATVVRRRVDADGNTVPSGCGDGVIFLEHLVDGYTAVTG